MVTRKKNLTKKLSLALSSTLLASALYTLPPAPPAEAFSIGNAIGAVIGVSAQYAALNKQVNYLDGEGRDKYMSAVKEKEGVNEDPEANAMLDDVMTRLTAVIAKEDPTLAKKPYHYFVNNNKNFNTYCTLGHNVSVNIGLFTTLNYNEDEVAFVLGHELTHGQRNDPANGVKNTFPISLLAAVAGSQSNMLQAVGTQVLANLGSAKLVTMPMEKKADEVGFTYAVEAGYNPGGGSALWQRVIEKMGTSKETFLGSVFNPSDHPGNISRRDKYTERMYEYSGNKVNVDSKTGVISVNKKAIGTVKPGGSMSALERGYLVAGNLARVYHDEPNSTLTAYADYNALYFGGRRIMGLEYGDDGAAWAANLNAAQKPAAEIKKEAEKKAAEEKKKTTSTTTQKKTFKERLAEYQKTK